MCSMEFSFILSTCLTCTGLLIAYLTYLMHLRKQQDEYIHTIYWNYLNDLELVKLFNKIEWSNDTNPFTEKELKENGIEMERLLGYFNYVCYLIDKKKVNKHHLKIFTYMLGRLLANSAIMDYLSFISSFASENRLANPYELLCLAQKKYPSLK